MRRRPLPYVVLLSAATMALAVGSLAPASGPAIDAAEAAPADRGPRPERPPARQVADELDLITVVPALQEAFGGRYGGFWIEPARNRDRMHVAVVDATAEDAALVAELTGGHRQVVTDAVAFGYDDLLAAQDEIALTLDPEAGNFTVSTDVATNSVVVRTAARTRPPSPPPAQDAARRGAADEQAAAGLAPAPGGPPAPAPEAAGPRPRRGAGRGRRARPDDRRRADRRPVELDALRGGSRRHGREPVGHVPVHVGLLLLQPLLRVLRQHRRPLRPGRRLGRGRATGRST